MPIPGRNRSIGGEFTTQVRCKWRVKMQARNRRLMQIILLAVTVAMVLGSVVYWCFGNLSRSSRFGKLSIRLPDGSTAYVIRESWGLHTDQIAVSQNPDGCDPA